MRRHSAPAQPRVCRRSRCRRVGPLALPGSRVLSGTAPAGELCGLRPALVPGFLHDRRDFGVGHEALPALLVPVGDHPDTIVLGGITEDERAFGAVLLALLGAFGGEDLEELVEVLDLGIVASCVSFPLRVRGGNPRQRGSGFVSDLVG